jgi:splicing factor, arginine/serine-rich 1
VRRGMARIYVGNLPIDIRSKDVEDLFWKYGRIRDIDCKAPARPPSFAFVTFEHYQDAVDAIKGRDGVMFEGQRLRVEMSRQSTEATGYSGFGVPAAAPLRLPPARDLRRSEHRIIVSGLPPSASWQDVKDYFRAAGDIIYADVDKRGGGIVEFSSRADQERAIEKLDDSEFKNPFEKARIRVKKPREQMTEEDLERERKREEREERERREKRSRSRSRSRSRARGHDRTSSSRSRSRGRRNKRTSRSRSRSRSRSSSRGRRGKSDDRKGDD